MGSGSAGNCTLIRAGRTTVLIDCGFSARETARRLQGAGRWKEEVSAILLTHEHSDHVVGAAVASRRWQVPVFCMPRVAAAAGLDQTTTHGLESLNGDPFTVGDLEITPFGVPHDAPDTVGFVVEAEGIRLVHGSDMGRVTDDVKHRMADAHVVVVEANHDVDLTRRGPYPWALKRRILGPMGHLSNEAAGHLLAEVVGPRTEQVLLTHLSRTNNDPALALLAARAGLERSRRPGAALHLAPQEGPGTVIHL
ncbi:MAG: MBL fold metallo-hydrolase [Acidobacteriota bacterium]